MTQGGPSARFVQITFLTLGLFLVTAAASLTMSSLVARWIGSSGVILGIAGIAAGALAKPAIPAPIMAVA